MEADSTTYESNPKFEVADNGLPFLPFNTWPGNFELYKEFITNNGTGKLECQLVERLQTFGLLPNVMKCPTDKPECSTVCRPARVIDKMQWVCEGCSKRIPVRTGSFFFRLQCSILQAMQIILAWSSDADIEVAAEHFGIKAKIAFTIYDKLDELAIKEQQKRKLGGEYSVVLAEMYPDCVNRLSPDTTDQPHVHRILMLADTNHIPVSHWLYVLKEDSKTESNGDTDNQALKTQIEQVVQKAVEPNTFVVTGTNVPQIEGAYSLQQLSQHCDVDMHHFLTSRIWRQAVTICCASRSVCTSGLTASACACAIQRYLTTALYRVRHDDGFYRHVLHTIVDEFTDKFES